MIPTIIITSIAVPVVVVGLMVVLNYVRNLGYDAGFKAGQDIAYKNAIAELEKTKRELTDIMSFFEDANKN